MRISNSSRVRQNTAARTIAHIYTPEERERNYAHRHKIQCTAPHTVCACLHSRCLHTVAQHIIIFRAVRGMYTCTHRMLISRANYCVCGGFASSAGARFQPLCSQAGNVSLSMCLSGFCVPPALAEKLYLALRGESRRPYIGE